MASGEMGDGKLEGGDGMLYATLMGRQLNMTTFAKRKDILQRHGPIITPRSRRSVQCSRPQTQLVPHPFCEIGTDEMYCRPKKLIFG